MKGMYSGEPICEHGRVLPACPPCRRKREERDHRLLQLECTTPADQLELAAEAFKAGDEAEYQLSREDCEALVADIKGDPDWSGKNPNIPIAYHPSGCTAQEAADLEGMGFEWEAEPRWWIRRRPTYQMLYPTAKRDGWWGLLLGGGQSKFFRTLFECIAWLKEREQ